MTAEMITGLNQEVRVLGRTFHFQTELNRTGGPVIRTEVFVGGKVVATRDSRIHRADWETLDEDALRTLMKEHHSRVIDKTLERVRSYQKRKRRGPAETAPAAAPFDAALAKDLEPPSEEARRAAASAVRIRRIFGKFRLRLALDTEVPATEIAERLTTAARGFAWMMSLPTFPEIRLDEQMRCHLVSDHVNAWLAGGRDPAEGAAIWSEIVSLDDYVAEINHRAELVAFDRQLLAWGAAQVQAQGMTHETLDQLQWLSGLDPDLDRLLDRPEGTDDETWFDLLCQALSRTVPLEKP